jgi:hypothetical protein
MPPGGQLLCHCLERLDRPDNRGCLVFVFKPEQILIEFNQGRGVSIK